MTKTIEVFPNTDVYRDDLIMGYQIFTTWSVSLHVVRLGITRTDDTNPKEKTRYSLNFQRL